LSATDYFRITPKHTFGWQDRLLARKEVVVTLSPVKLGLRAKRASQRPALAAASLSREYALRPDGSVEIQGAKR